MMSRHSARWCVGPQVERFGFITQPGHCELCSRAKNKPFIVPLFTQVYKWVPGNWQGSGMISWGGGGGERERERERGGNLAM